MQLNIIKLFLVWSRGFQKFNDNYWRGLRALVKIEPNSSEILLSHCDIRFFNPFHIYINVISEHLFLHAKFLLRIIIEKYISIKTIFNNDNCL